MAQYYFAWVSSASDLGWSDAYKRFDEEIFDFQLTQNEGDFATLEITIVNPRIGLLAPGRDLWAWFGYEHPTLGTKPLFFGRLVGLPTNITESTVKLTFIARPDDYEQQKAALAETLKVAPYWDAIWFSPDTVDDPDNVLESRPAHWHIDRVTHLVTISNVIEGEDGNVVLGEGDVFFDSIKVDYLSPPVRSVKMTATVSWDQKASGFVDITERIKAAFGGVVASYTGEGLQKGWPKAGTNMDGGWSVATSKCDGVAYVAPYVVFEPGYAKGAQDRGTFTPYEDFQFDALFQPHGGLRFVKSYFNVNLTLGYDVSRQKSEVLSFELVADVQAIVTDAAGQDILALTMSSSEITQPVDPGGLVPLTDNAARSYFTTDRGTQSIEYLLAVARAQILARSRCVKITVEFPFDDGVAADVTCRKNAVFTSGELPGGIATGKITEYRLALDGDTGQSTCEVVFESTVGRGGSVVAVTGTPDYVEDDYVESGYQQHSGGFILPTYGDLIYAPIAGDPPNDDGIDFHRIGPAMIVRGVSVAHMADDQESRMPFHGDPTTGQPLGDWSQYYITNDSPLMAGLPGFRPDYDPSKAIEALNAVKTTVTLTLRDITGGPFETDYNLDVSPIQIPKLIDLEAAS
jgi:hypothetical protein